MYWRVELAVGDVRGICVRVNQQSFKEWHVAGGREIKSYPTFAEAQLAAEEQLLVLDAERRLRASHPDTNIPDVGE